MISPLRPSATPSPRQAGVLPRSGECPDEVGKNLRFVLHGSIGA